MKKTKKTRSGGTGCSTQWVSGSRPGKPARCRCGQTNCSCHVAGIQRSGRSPWHPGYAGWKTVIAGSRKKSCSSKEKWSKKQLVASLKNRLFFICGTGKGSSSRTRNVMPVHCGQKNCLCRRAGIQTWRWSNGQPGSSGLLPCVLSRRKESLSWKGILPRKVRSSLTCKQIAFLSCGKNTATRPCSGVGAFLYFIYWILGS